MIRACTIAALALLAGCASIPEPAPLAQVRAEQKAKEDAAIRQYVDTITKVEDDIQKRARERQARFQKECDAKGSPTIGMHWQRLYATCWGKPQRVNSTKTAGGSHDQIVYPYGYVYLTNGTVTAIQTSR